MIRTRALTSISMVLAVAAAEGEVCAGSVAAGKKTAPASTMLIEVSARVRIMGRSLPRAPKSQNKTGYTNVCVCAPTLHQRMPPDKRNNVLQFWPQITLVCSPVRRWQPPGGGPGRTRTRRYSQPEFEC